MQIKIGNRFCEVCYIDCAKYKCFVPGEYQHRRPNINGGSSNTGHITYCCMTNYYHGCPKIKKKQ